MIDFLPEQVRTLNELETAAFNFILSNLSTIDKMSVRQLAQAVHVSTATVMRMTRKLGFEGWVELKYYLKNQNQLSEIPVNYYENLLQLDLFLRKINSKEAGIKLEEAVKLIREARYIIFIGVGSSGALAEYGARYFTNIGLESYAISDPYQAVKGKGAPDVLSIVLSASGETDKIIERVVKLREEASAKIVSITNHPETTLSKLSNINLTYGFQTEHSAYDPLENLTSQLPVIAFIEILAHQAIEKSDNRN